MQTISVNYTLLWFLNLPGLTHYKFTKCGKCFNCKTGKELQKKYNSGSIGFNINGRFMSIKSLRKSLKKIEVSAVPF